MTKFLLLNLIFCFTVLNIYSQSLELENAFGKVNNGDTITLAVTANQAILLIGVNVKNTSNTDLNVKVRKIDIQLVTGSSNHLCWTGCYTPAPPATSLASGFVSDELLIEAGTSTSLFTGDYNSHGNSGKSSFRYTFFDENNPNDSVSFIAIFYAGSGVGIDRSSKASIVSSIFPNPANNNITINYELNDVKYAKFEIRNILGITVKLVDIPINSSSINININELTNGVYFYYFITDDRLFSSKKIVIQH
ncbi:MAG: T9SS type A sorting domain-containing protein [Bacteroidales bacterium]|nr:T9SS type A sorting domain-containing protein [Bacteroidales bacterium]